MIKSHEQIMSSNFAPLFGKRLAMKGHPMEQLARSQSALFTRLPRSMRLC